MNINSFTIAGAVVAGVTYLFLCVQVARGVPQNFATWLLWAMIDVVATISIASGKGNFLLPLVYSAGSVATATVIFLAFKKFRWTSVETMTAVLVAICLATYLVFGGKAGAIVSTISVGIAGIPQAGDLWLEPQEDDWPIFLVYTSFLVSNVLTAIGGKNWSIEERYYPTFCAVMCIIIVCVIARGIVLKKRLLQGSLASA